MRLIHIDDGDALNIDCVVVNKADSKDCKCFYSCDLIDQYEARLKADKEAMLEDLDLEIDEIEICKSISREDIYFKMGAKAMKEKTKSLIQERINALRGEKNGENS